ncbi:MAG: EAL domain-containing protein [Candidatus Woesearchaeota archaeon]
MEKYTKRLYIWVIIVFFVVTFGMFIQHYNNNRLVEKNVEEMTALSMNLLNEKINSWLNEKAQVVEDSGDLISMGYYNDEEKLELLRYLLDKNDEFFSIYYGTDENKMINGSGWKPSEDFDLRQRPWYEKAVKEDDLIYTEAFVNASNDDIIITIAKPVYNRKTNEFMGVIAGDLSISTIISYVKNEKSAEEGFFMLVDSDNKILAHPEVNYSLEEGVPKVSEKYNENILSELNGSQKIKKITLNDKEGFFSQEKVPNTDWYLVNFVPISEYTDIYNRMLRSFLTALLIATTIFIIFFYIHNKYVLSPLKKFDKNIAKIDLENNLNYRLEVDKKSDLSFLSKTINEVLDKTQDYFDELKRKRKEIKFLANHDSLTELPNRRSFMKELKNELKKENSGAVMLLDLDNFKDVNDTLGHTYGDKVLEEIANKLMKLKSKNLFISRFGGDEFLILIKNAKEISIINKWIAKVEEIFSTPFTINNNKIHINFSMGISLYPHDSSDANQLIANADTAMYKVKNNYRGKYMYFNQNMIEQLQEKKKVRAILRTAIKNDGFVLNYQPQVNLKSGKADKFEALIRLKNHALSPGKFIPIAEESGMINKIGRWVTENAIKELNKWKEKGLNEKSIAINFSAEQLYDENYISFLKRNLDKYNVNPELLEIEITESILFENKKVSMNFLDELKKLGVKVALDDFGTGYSSFNQLSFIPADYIKFDRSLMERFVYGNNKKAIDSLISLVHSLDIKVVAEGIEEKKLYSYLKENGCDYIQGYIFSKALSSSKILKIYNKDFMANI